MNILIVSFESWRETNNGGNVLSNIFASFDDANIAQIYCSGELPQNSVCCKYFQISDSMLFSKSKGKALDEKYYNENVPQSDAVENKIKSRLPHCFREAALLAREVLWSCFNWKTQELRKFISDFRPDIIFAPCYSYFHVSKLALYAKSIANCPMISYISDDNYSLKQLRVSPSFWINRIITRKWIRRHFAESSLIYTMTDLQKKEYGVLFGRPMKVLCKAADFSAGEKIVGSPVRLIYAGGLYLNRWKVLKKLALAIEKINEAEKKAELHIYSGSQLNRRKTKNLNDQKNSFLHKSIPYQELIEQYKKSDIAVHVESFDLKNRLITRLSFSTKIIDCMNSGCALLAIGPSSQAGIAYLKENDAAICVSNVSELDSVLKKTIDNPELITKYAGRAKELGIKNHSKTNIENNLKQDFFDIMTGKTPNT
jgi:hypothetical protein